MVAEKRGADVISKTRLQRSKFLAPNERRSRGLNYSRLIEVVEGADAVDEKLQELSSKGKSTVCAFVTGKFSSEKRTRLAQARDAEMYAKGVRSRAIYLNEVRDDQAALEYVRWINEQGSEVRTAPFLPMQMIISDNKLAVLPFVSKSGKHAIIIHRDPNVVKCLQALFELTWASTAPIGMIFDKEGQPISVEGRAILDLLAIGRIDREIGEMMGTHERTVARRIADLMKLLNAKTRFMAGVRFAKRNLV